MAVSLKFYHDAALTQEVTSLAPALAQQDVANSLPPVQKQLWLGSVATGFTFKAQSNPGVDNITVSPADANGATGQTTAALKLASSQAGLAAAVAGASLTLVPTITSGVSNAITFWVEINDLTSVAGSYTDLSLTTNPLFENPV